MGYGCTSRRNIAVCVIDNTLAHVAESRDLLSALALGSSDDVPDCGIAASQHRSIAASQHRSIRRCSTDGA
jgi:hypothetical protein